MSHSHFDSDSTVIKGDDHSDLEAILDLTKWTPSGDNAQEWQFEIKSDREVHFLIHNEGSVYDFDGKPSMLTIGMLIESFKIASSSLGYYVDWKYQSIGDSKHVVMCHLTKNDSISVDPLSKFLKIRSVNRFPYLIKPLAASERTAMENVLGEHLKIRWFENFRQRLQFAQLSAMSTDIRLSIKEAYATHKNMMDFDNDFSIDKVPAKASGVSWMTQKVMQWALGSWGRVAFLNTFFLGTVIPQIELDLIPGIFCGGHFIIEWKDAESAKDPQIVLAAGQALQRFWLTLTQLGLSMQPEIGLLAFSYYGENKIPFTASQRMRNNSEKLAQHIDKIAPVNNIVFMGRVGTPRTTLVKSRSIRKNLPDLLKTQ